MLKRIILPSFRFFHFTGKNHISFFQNRLFRIVPFFTNPGILVYPIFIQYGLIQSSYRTTACIFHLENNNLIFTFLQPGSRNIKRLLRTNIPILTQRFPIHPHSSFSPSPHIQKTIPILRQLNLCPIKSRLSPDILFLPFHSGKISFIQRQRSDRPIFQFFSIQSHLFSNTLQIIQYIPSIIHTSYIFHQNLKFCRHLLYIHR